MVLLYAYEQQALTAKKSDWQSLCLFAFFVAVRCGLRAKPSLGSWHSPGDNRIANQGEHIERQTCKRVRKGKRDTPVGNDEHKK